MNTISSVSSYLRSLFVGTPFGVTYPKRPPPRSAVVDGRTAGLEVLKSYVSELTFFRPGTTKTSRPIPFQIRLDDVHVEAADHEQDEKFPSISFIQVQDGTYNPIGLTALTLEDTRDKYGVGSVLVQQSQYVENVAIEVFASLKPERRAIIKGLEEALVPTDYLYGIRFSMPEYYDQVATFSLVSRKLDEGPDVARHRRMGNLVVEMTYNVVALVNYVEFRPILQIDVDVDGATEQEVVLDPNDPNTRIMPP